MASCVEARDLVAATTALAKLAAPHPPSAHTSTAPSPAGGEAGAVLQVLARRVAVQMLSQVPPLALLDLVEALQRLRLDPELGHSDEGTRALEAAAAR